jgi:1,2-diacylglycerol 3-alpha-glucosyltransferase
MTNEGRLSAPPLPSPAVAVPRIAIASSGLGHINRGVESWANDLAVGLHRKGIPATLFQAAGTPAEPWRHTLSCLRRFDRRTKWLYSLTKHLSGWRYGCGSAYDIEQTTFSLPLWRAIHKDYDILHVQDIRVAIMLDAFYRKGWSRPRVIFGNGTEESDSDLGKFQYLQHVAPYYQQLWETKKPPGQLSFAVPYFVDTGLFLPGDRKSARATWNLPQDTLIILCVAAVKKQHKRCDYVIREFAQFRKSVNQPALLVMAGAREQETPELIELAASLLQDSAIVLQSVDRGKLSSLYRAADIFTIGSLHEMLGIAILEALSSGLPITCNRAPVFEWVAGPAAAPEDISQPGGLVRQWVRLLDPAVRARWSAAARIHAEETFSEAVVLKQTLEMYDTVMGNPPRSGREGRVSGAHAGAIAIL